MTATTPQDAKLKALLNRAVDALRSNDDATGLALLNDLLSRPDLPVAASYPALYDRAKV